MKTFTSFLAIILLFSVSGFTQNCPVGYSDYATMPQATVNVVFHFLHDNRAGKTDFTQAQANTLSEIFTFNANENLRNMKTCNRAGPNNIIPPQISDTKVQLNHFNQAVFLYDHTDKGLISKPYGDNVLNIILSYNGAATCENEGQTIGGYIVLCNIGVDILDGTASSQSELVKRARVICHELGHVLNLQKHSFDGDCECGGIDISPSNESSNGYGNNIMSYGGQSSTDPLNWNCAITPCQWGKIFDYMIRGDANGLPKYISWPSCNLSADIVIASGDVITWNSPKIVSGNIVVKTGGFLQIKCLVRMGSNCVITVQRGAKLVIDGGKITKLCDEKWGD